MHNLLQQALTDLGPYCEELVLVGGCARDFYRHLAGFEDLSLRPPATNDIDFALSDPLQVVGGKRLSEMLTEKGWIYHSSDGLDHKPMSCRFFPPDTKRPSLIKPHLEFVTPLYGPDRETNAQPQKDVLIAYALRFIGLLLENAVKVENAAFGVVRIPHPVRYIIQKTLIRPKRLNEAKAAKDQADAFYVLVSLRAKWAEWVAEWQQIAQNHEQKKWLQTVLRQWDELYRTTHSAGTREVSSAFPDFSPDDVSRVMMSFAGYYKLIIN